MWPFSASLTLPDQDIVENGGKYAIVLDVAYRPRTGKIWNEKGDLLWHYEQRADQRRYSFHNPLKKPDFVLFDNKERPAVTIRRISLLPSRFDVLKDKLVVGHIAMKSPLLNRYRIEIDGIATCIFQMPLFTVYFHGRVNSDTKIWVVMGPFKNQWSVLTHLTIDSAPVVAALAFIHSQWYL